MTTTVEVNDDNCGYKTLITVSKLSADLLSLNVQSGCRNVKETVIGIGQNLNSIDVVKPFKENIVHGKAAENMPGCVVCVVPCAIAKALWAELGMALRKDTRIRFVTLADR